MPTLLPKYRVRRVVDELPDDVSLEDVIKRLVSLYEQDRLEEAVAEPRPRYTLDQLLEGFEHTDEDREWLDAPPVGRELLRIGAI